MDRTVKDVAPLESICGTGLTRLEDDNLLNGCVERIFIFFLDAKMLQFKGNLHQGTLKHALNILWFDEAVANIDRERTRLIRKFDFIEIRPERLFHGPMFSSVVDDASAGGCLENNQ